MKVEKVEGLIIGETNYSESSKILKVFTKEHGIISIMSKGCRNLKSKLRGVSTKLTYASFQIHYKEDGISTLTEADVIDTLKNIRLDIEKIYYVSYIIDIAEQVYKHSSNKSIYDILISVIKKINENYDPSVLIIIMKLKLLDFLGIKPNVDSCSICGNTKNILTISIDDGGFICQNCYKCGKIYNDKIIKLIRMFVYIDIDSITKINLSDGAKKELEQFIYEYYDVYSGIYLKELDLKKISKLEI